MLRAFEGSKIERRELVDGTNDKNTLHWPSRQISDFEKQSKGVELGLLADLVRILAHRADPSPQDRRRQLAARQADRQTRSGAFALQNAVGI